MSRVVVYLIRHATTPKVGKGLTGWTPGVSLDEKGRAQAKNLTRRLGFLPISAIYSSPLERTMETAQPLANMLKLEIREHRAFGEIHFGEWQGQDFPEIEQDSRWKRFNEFRSATPAPGGETMLETQSRFVRGLIEIATLHPAQEIAIFSHADAIKAVVAHFLGIPLDFHLRMRIDPASVTILELCPEGCVVRSVNITGSLSE